MSITPKPSDDGNVDLHPPTAELDGHFEDVLDGVESTTTPWDSTHFFRVSKPWRDLGFTVIPSNGPTSKEPLKGQSWKRWCGEGRQPVPEGTWREWCSRYADHEGLLLLDSSTGGHPDLAVVDADHPSVFAWVEETFGPSAFSVESGRDGGGRHYYYTVPTGAVVTSRNGMIGPTESFTWIPAEDHEGRGRWKGKIDVKSHRAYVVAPGSRHKSGRIYRASRPFSEWATAEFDGARYEYLSVTCKPGTLTHGKVPHGTHLPSERIGTGSYRREVGSNYDVIPGPGPLAGLSLSQAAARLRFGETAECGCPFHPSVSGRSATLRVLLTGAWRLSCHVEQVTYEPESYEPPVGVPDESRAAKLAEERETDLQAGRISLVTQAQEVMGQLVEHHPLVRAHLELVEATRALDGLLDEPMSSGLSKETSKRAPGTSEDDVAEAIELVGGTSWVACTRGPWAHRPREGGYTTWRLAVTARPK